jgi:IrrE N-terminal-like domain
MKDQGVRIDLWPYPLRQLRGAYFNDAFGPTIMVAKGLPDEPAIFTMGHELKHHLVDGELVMNLCSESNVHEAIEIGAEVFAAELIFPEADFADCLHSNSVTTANFHPDHLVHLKRRTSTTLSFAGLVKRVEHLGFATPGSMKSVQWKKREEALYGEPVYKRIQRMKRARADRSAPI